MSRPLLPDAWLDYPTLTIREAGMVTGLSPSTIRRRLEEGKLRRCSSGGGIVFIVTNSLATMLGMGAPSAAVPKASPRAHADAAEVLRRLDGDR